MTSLDTIIAFVRDHPRCTAQEAGVTVARMNELEGAHVVRVGTRRTGKKGKPPIEWVIIGTEITPDESIKEQAAEAQARIDAFRKYERLSSKMVQAANEHGHNSPEHVDAKLARIEAFELGLPDLPTKNDYVLAGDQRHAVEPIMTVGEDE